MLSLRVSRDKRGYDHIYLLQEIRRKGRTVSRLLYGGRWPSPMKIGQPPLDEATRRALEQAYPEVTFDWLALQKTLQQALSTPRAPLAPGGGPGAGPRMRRGGQPGASAPGRPAQGSGASRGGPQGSPGTRQPMPPRPRPSTPAPYEPPEAALVADIPDAAGVIDIVELEEVTTVDAGPDLEIEVVEQTFVVSASPTELVAGIPDPEPIEPRAARGDDGDDDDGEDEETDDESDDEAASPESTVATASVSAGAAPSSRAVPPTGAARRRRRRRRRGRRSPQTAESPFVAPSTEASGTGEERARTESSASPESDRAPDRSDDPPV